VSEPFLAADDVTVRFGGLVAVDSVSIAVDRGDLVGVIGPNGAGKSTLFNALAGTVALAGGSVRMDGVDVTEWRPDRRARAGIARTFQRLEVFGSMTVRENLLYATEAAALAERPWRLLARRRHQDRALADETIALVGLADVADRPVAELPTGQARIVEFARAVCARPAVVLLDEPSSGLDAVETAALTAAARDAAGRWGFGVLLVEHDLSMVFDLCTWLHVLDFGCVIASGPAGEVAALDRVRDAYLGTVDAG
jgi:ABC-type branched-subunit amino acid transport system ATPase component